MKAWQVVPVVEQYNLKLVLLLRSVFYQQHSLCTRWCFREKLRQRISIVSRHSSCQVKINYYAGNSSWRSTSTAANGRSFSMITRERQFIIWMCFESWRTRSSHKKKTWWVRIAQLLLSEEHDCVISASCCRKQFSSSLYAMYLYW